MILSDRSIKKALKTGALRLDPWSDDSAIQPASIDLRLGDFFLAPNRHYSVLDVEGNHGWPHLRHLRDQDAFVQRPYVGEHIVLEPGEFVLGQTVETVGLDETLVARVDGRSTIGRFGVTVHVTAGFIDPGFEGVITLEIANLNPNKVRLPIGGRICQLVIQQLSSACEEPYGAERGSKYQGQDGVTAPRSL